VAYAILSAAGPKIVKKIIAGAEAGDPHLQGLFIRYLLPRSKLVETPVDREPIASVDEAAARIAETPAKVEKGDLDVDEARVVTELAQAFVQARNVGEIERRAEEGRTEIARLKEEIAEMVRRTRT
jgi:hypothetical protein